MSKKLLSESQIRRFQGLAGIPALDGGETPSSIREEEEELEAVDVAVEEPELPGDEGPEDDLGMMGMEASDEGGDIDLSPEQKESLAADIVRAVAQELEGALQLDEPIQVDVEAEPAMDAELGMDVEIEAPLEDDEELDLEAPDALEEEAYSAKEEEPGEDMRKGAEKRGAEGTLAQTKGHGKVDYVKEEVDEETVDEAIDDEAVVNEVLRRVLARLSAK